LRDALESLLPGGVVGGKGVLLESDVDRHGNPWGYEWMQQEPIGLEEDGLMKVGDSRPDWEVDKEIDSGVEADLENGGDSTDDDRTDTEVVNTKQSFRTIT
jgi:hypothetical protein